MTGRKDIPALSDPLPARDALELLERAREARTRAYAPYSRFPVGAALLDDSGAIHVGTNVENASYGLTICAERAAVFRAVAEGARSFRAIAIAGPYDDQPCPPCGSCRQVLHEFAPDLMILVSGASGSIDQLPLRSLLPFAFGPDRIGPDRIGLDPGHPGLPPTDSEPPPAVR